MTEQPRILVLFGNIPLHGQERANIEVMDVLQKNGCEVLFLIREEWTKDTVQAALEQRGLRWVAVPWFDAIRKGHGLRVWWRNITGILGGSIALIRWKHRFRATHIHCSDLSNALNFLPALTITRIPIVYRAGDVPTGHHLLWREVFACLKWRVNIFVANSQFIKKELEALGVDAAKITQIYSIPSNRGAFAHTSKSQDKKDGVTFVYVGQLTEEKGVGLLVDAAISFFGKYKSSRLLIAGDYSWNNEFAAGLIRKVSDGGFEEVIQFLGYVEAVPELLQKSSVHICPSIWEEPLANVVMEAKAAGIPSIIFPSGGLPEMVTHLKNGFVCSDKSISSLIEAMTYYLNDKRRVDEQGIQALSSLNSFGHESFAKTWLEVFRLD